MAGQYFRLPWLEHGQQDNSIACKLPDFATLRLFKQCLVSLQAGLLPRVEAQLTKQNAGAATRNKALVSFGVFLIATSEVYLTSPQLVNR